MATAGVHVSPFAGSWYPGDRDELRDLVARLFEGSQGRTGPWLAPRAAGFVVPHAGLVYSGTVAAAAYRQIGAVRPARAIVLGFAHRGSPRGCWIPDVEAYRTPVAEFEVDREGAARLIATGAFGCLAEERLCDHSIEIQLPLLAQAAPDARVLPVYVSGLDAAQRSAAADALAADIATGGGVLIASSDFTHFGRSFGYQPFPADRWAGERLRELDDGTVEAASSLDSELFLASVRATGSTVCGTEPISLLLETMTRLEADEEIFQERLDYQTSGEITGDFHHSVSYAALGFFPYRALQLNADDLALLQGSVRHTLARYSETGQRTLVPPERRTPGTERRATAFVSLHVDGQLRGCVGRSPAGEPLSKTVSELALCAALDDSRFEHLDRRETGIESEISILTPLKLVRDRSRFRVNEHGAMLVAGYHHGLLLPQVAPERGWTAQQFFSALAHKSGVGQAAYADRTTKLFVFRAQVVGSG